MTVETLNKLREINRIISTDEIRHDILVKYCLLAEAMASGGAKDLLISNRDTYKAIFCDTVLNWLKMEKASGSQFITQYIQRYPELVRLLDNSDKTLKTLNSLDIYPEKLETFESIQNGLRCFGIETAENINEDELGLNIGDDIDSINIDELFDDFEMDDEADDIEVKEEQIEEDTENFSDETDIIREKYYPKIHDSYKNKISDWLSEVWEDLYGNYVNGTEIVNGLIVPGETILSHGEDRKYCGILRLSNKTTVNHEIIANGIYEEFFNACKEVGIPLINKVSDDSKKVRKYTYHPLFQRRIVSGSISPTAFKNGWREYSSKLMERMENEIKEIAIELEETGSDAPMYERLSGYITSLIAINNKPGLGMQLRICCGDTSKTEIVAKRFRDNLIQREKTHRALANGKLIVSEPIISGNGYSFTVAIYTNMAGYQAVPQFMGELLYNMQEGTFKPSVDNMIIGTDLDNEIVTAPFTNWLLPIIAWTRSGKGVLTLNMLLNVIGNGTPLFYLDGKPDMASLLWNMNKKHGIHESIVVDGIGYKGITDIDKKPYKAPYAGIVERKMRSENAYSVLTSNIGIMIYIKTMLVILMSVEYYKTEMGGKYGNIFVVFDEVYKIIVQQGTGLGTRLDTEENKAKSLGKDEKNAKMQEILKIRNFVNGVMRAYIGNDIGVFGNGIKAVALTQHAMVEKYKVQGLDAATQFAKGFLLQRGPKLFGRQGSYSGMYGMKRGKDNIVFDLYDKYFHFGIGDSNDTDTDSAKTFKPLLVLNESDPKEVIGGSEDGAFVKDMMSRIRKVANESEFRDKYFKGDPALTQSIGFEGALDQVSRLTGTNWVEGYQQSMGRAYEIADGALRYYGIIGQEGINNVYDYICSCDLEHLWSWDDIVEAKRKGVPLGEMSVDREDGGGSDMFDFQDEPDGDDFFGDDEDDEIIDFGIQGNNIENNLNNKFEEYKAERINKESTISKELREQQKLAGLGNTIITNGNSEEQDEYEQYEGNIDYEQETDTIEINGKRFTREDINALALALNLPINEEITHQSGGKTGRQNYINKISKTSEVIGLTTKNSIVATMDDYETAERFGRTFFKGLWGSRWEFQKRWEAILNAITKSIKANMVTRMTLTADNIFVNNRQIVTMNILGGDSDVRIEDIVEFSTLCKRFPQLKSIAMDSAIGQRLNELYPADANGRLFNMSKSLLTIIYLGDSWGEDGIQITRANYEKGILDKKLQDKQEEMQLKSQINAMAAANNPRLKEKSPGYQSRIWESTKKFQGEAWGSVGKNITSKNPSLFKATTISAAALIALGVGGVLGGAGKLLSLFRR